jgi:uncharacterized metal-binding protein YceD (DUF177 family)
VAVDDVSDHGLHRAIDAPAEVRAKVLELVAGLASVRELPRLSALFDIARQGAHVRVTGHVRAHVSQNCVVTLEPLESDVEEAVDLRFAPASGDGPQLETEFSHDASDGSEEPPEPLRDGAIDLGAIAIEFLVLGINPYPRKPGAEFAPVTLGEDAAHPFAALEALKKPPGGGKA